MRIPANQRYSMIQTAIQNGMKVLTFDTETSHAIVRTFYIGRDVSINHQQVKVPNKVITIQYKWAHEKKAKYLEWDRVSKSFDDARNFDDSSMIEEFVTNVLNKADIIVTQNGDAFDFKVLNERAKELHISHLPQIPSLDILKLSRKSFKALSHKLDYRSSQQGLGGKIKMMDDDWVDIEERGVSPSKKMVPYGLKDTVDTEKLMFKELPYYKDLPVSVERVILNFAGSLKPTKENLFCPVCEVRKRPKFNVKVTKQGIECKNCGGIS